MMNTTVFIIIATLFYTAFQIFNGLAGGKISGNVLPIIVSVVAIIIQFSIYGYLRGVKHQKILPTKPAGLAFALLAGVGIAGFAIAFAKSFEHGARVSYVAPLVFGSSILLSSLIGMLLLHEKASTLQLMGLLLIVSGLVVVAVAKLKTAA